jgi:perosamine synthetase
VFADVDPSTFAVSIPTVEAALTPETAAVILVHIGGLITPEAAALRRLCDDRGVALVEDAAHAHGCSYDGVPAGSFGVAGTFSFYPTKVITSGEGGMIVTADDRLCDEALLYRDQGKAGFLGNQHVRLGYAWRMSEIHAAVGLVHLRRLPEFLRRRNEIADLYTRGLAGTAALTPVLPPAKGFSNHYKYVCLLDPAIDRARLKADVRAFGVSLAGEVYETPLHRQPVFAHLASRELPVADDVCGRHVCLPLHSEMTDDEAEQVVAAVRQATGS